MSVIGEISGQLATVNRYKALNWRDERFTSFKVRDIF